ncbi:Carboxypeptidase Y, putative [Candida maltosa Xu316]|uniref:Carboxypeptidase n=1 Tax=Candida maltosa (strain Xu316) TaxID=1245528 RepID=M3JU69_CANMX|nr:Carboxypeptidase Y, putative [Candida maltosa Xu316]
MKFPLVAAALVSIAAALPPQTPFSLSPLQQLKDELIGKISHQQLFQLELDWMNLENQYGLKYMLNKLDEFKSTFDYPGQQHTDTEETYSIQISDTTAPELLGFDDVKQYAGYFNVNNKDKNYFFWFFESRNDPQNDPFVIWLNGGPGCSSLCGLALELGPSIINATLQPEFNPHAWNSNASVLFLDQPADVGFSYGGNIPITSDQASTDFVEFIKLFYERFPEYQHLDLHISGESYGGHYVPAFAHAVHNANIPLKSVLIGNGITDALVQLGEVANMGCGAGEIGKIYTDKECEEYPAAYEKFVPYGQLCYDHPNVLTCFIAALYSPKQPDKGDLNRYDSRLKCGNNSLCYDQIDYLNDYFNLESVQKALGVEKSYTMCTSDVGTRFVTDFMRPYQQYIAELLDDQIPVLIYVGDKDLACDWVGNLAWVNKLNYTEHEEFSHAIFKPWYTNTGKLAGEVKNHNHFTYLRIYDSGHMVPMDQPENSLDMLNRWINGDLKF